MSEKTQCARSIPMIIVALTAAAALLLTGCRPGGKTAAGTPDAPDVSATLNVSAATDISADPDKKELLDYFSELGGACELPPVCETLSPSPSPSISKEELLEFFEQYGDACDP
ncbi:MAG: hypothetical protein ACOX88_06935 [Christensenellales bacterium]|jgi:hypothetical protein